MSAAGPLAGRLAVVTGGGRGIGREVAVGLAATGADILLASRTGPELAETCEMIIARGARPISIIADLATESGIDSLLAVTREQSRPVTVLINNAGAAGPFGATWEVEPAAWEQLLRLNLVAPFRLCGALVPGMIASKFGRIVNITSSAGRVPLERAGAYSSAKAALDMLTRQLASELREFQGVSVTSFAPGPVDTAAYAELRAQPLGLVGQKNFHRFRETTRAGRLSAAVDVARVAVAIACEPATALSGECVDVSDEYARSILSTGVAR